MCLIILAPKGVSKSSELLAKAIVNGSITNDDGMGFMYKEGNEIFMQKGFKTVEELNEAMSKINMSDENGELGIHMRIGNKGAKNDLMCHPFICSTDEEDSQALHKYTDKPVLMHNGTFIGLTLPEGESDTYVFTQKYMSNPCLQELLYDYTSIFTDVMRSTLSTSRLLVMYPQEDKEFVKLGMWEEEDGYYFSNTTYKDTTIKNIGGETVAQGTGSQSSRRGTSYRRESILSNKVRYTERQQAALCNVTGGPKSKVLEIKDYKGLCRMDTLRPNMLKNVHSTFTNCKGIEMSTHFGLFYDKEGIYTTDLVSNNIIPNIVNYPYLRLQALRTSISLGISESRLYKINRFMYNEVKECFVISLTPSLVPAGFITHNTYLTLEEVMKNFRISINFSYEGLQLAFMDCLQLVDRNSKNIKKICKQIKGKLDNNFVNITNVGYVPVIAIKWFLFEIKTHIGRKYKLIKSDLGLTTSRESVEV